MIPERIQFVSPLPPLPTGIAQYSDDLLHALGGQWPLDIVGEGGSRPNPERGSAPLTSFKRGVPTIFQIGNSGFHRIAYKHALDQSGILVLHDVLLHHGRSGELLRTAGGSAYPRLMRQRYGDAGARAVKDILSGRPIDDLRAFPLSEDYIERARVTIVHSEYARDLVLRAVPGANVVVVPMGIPLPSLVDQSVARASLGLPNDAFIVASVTHVNPYKRLPVVLRAMRRLIAREPESLLVIAGSVAPGIDLQRQVSLLNLDRNVRLLGYVSDDEARLVARASDVCINLRYPSAGETSASLLRLLGAGRPVLVTDDAPMAAYPRDVVVPISIDRFEDEMIADVLQTLASDSQLRLAAGDAARSFVQRQHNLIVAIEGYRSVIQTAFDIGLPIPPNINVEEVASDRAPVNPPQPYSFIDARVADALAGLRLASHDATIQAASVAMTTLGLNNVSAITNEWIHDEAVTPDSERTPGYPRLPGL